MICAFYGNQQDRQLCHCFLTIWKGKELNFGFITLPFPSAVDTVQVVHTRLYQVFQWLISFQCCKFVKYFEHLCKTKNNTPLRNLRKYSVFILEKNHTFFHTYLDPYINKKQNFEQFNNYTYFFQMPQIKIMCHFGEFLFHVFNGRGVSV